VVAMERLSPCHSLGAVARHSPLLCTSAARSGNQTNLSLGIANSCMVLRWDALKIPRLQGRAGSIPAPGTKVRSFLNSKTTPHEFPGAVMIPPSSPDC